MGALPAGSPASTNLETRSGWARAYTSAKYPPIEFATMAARERPRLSITE